MRSDIYRFDGPWPGRLAVAARPRGGDWLTDEIASWRQAGVQVVVSMLTTEEAVQLELGSEAADCRASGIEFIAFPTADCGVPESAAAFRHLVSELTAHLNDGRMVVVHCRQGIGRAGLVAVGLLIAAGIDVADAVERVTKARGRPVPETAEQRRWIEDQARAPITRVA
jgi:protein-tyrosine phosphatase